MDDIQRAKLNKLNQHMVEGEILTKEQKQLRNELTVLQKAGTDGTRDIFGNGIGVSQLAVGVIGLGLVGLFAVKYHQRATNKFFSSLLTTSNRKLSRIYKSSYLLRGPMFAKNGKAPINSLDLRDAFKAVAVIGANRSGKTVFISNYILEDMFPWWFRTRFQQPWSAINDFLIKRRNEQRVRLFLQEVFNSKVPKFLEPQPAIIIVDQAEELLKAYRANFLVDFYNLAKE
eukprot:gene2619-3561_t